LSQINVANEPARGTRFYNGFNKELCVLTMDLFEVTPVVQATAMAVAVAV
jgi:hypothetical protein